MKRHRFFLLVALAITILLAYSCVPNQEETQKMVRKIKLLETEVSELRDKVDSLDEEISGLNAQLAESNKLNKRLSQSIDAKINNAAQMEKEKLAKMIADFEKKAKASPSVVSKPKTSSSKKSSPKQPVVKETRVKPKGKYYDIKEGDTIASLSKKFSVSASKIRSANMLPRGYEPKAGQQLFIPF